ERMEEEDLLLHELEGRQHHVLAGPLHVLEVFDRREAVSDLPEEVRQKEQQRDPAADPDPTPAELSALRRGEERENDGRTEEQHRVLVLETESREDAEGDPVARVTRTDDPDQGPDATHPKQRLE